MKLNVLLCRAKEEKQVKVTAPPCLIRIRSTLQHQPVMEEGFFVCVACNTAPHLLLLHKHNPPPWHGLQKSRRQFSTALWCLCVPTPELGTFRWHGQRGNLRKQKRASHLGASTLGSARATQSRQAGRRAGEMRPRMVSSIQAADRHEGPGSPFTSM